MTGNRALWQIIRRNVPRKTWLSIVVIYDIVERHAALDTEDLKPGRLPTGIPCWKTNVRRILKAKQREGEVIGRKV